MQKIKVHWLIDAQVQDAFLSAQPSIRLRLGAASQSALLNIRTGNQIHKDTNIVVFPKFTFTQSDHDKIASANIKLAKDLKELGIKVVLDYTDHHLIEAPSSTGFISSALLPHIKSQQSKNASYYKEIIQIASAIVVSSGGLAEKIKTYTKSPVYVVQDAIDKCKYIQPLTHSNTSGRTAFWFGMPANFTFLLEHLEFFDSLEIDELVIHCLSSESLIKNIKSNAFKIPRLRSVKLRVDLWSLTKMSEVAKSSDVIIIPSNVDDKRKSLASSNRLLTGFSLLRPVVATKIPSYAPYSDLFFELPSKEGARILRGETFDVDMVERAHQLSQGFLPEKMGAKWHDTFRLICNQNL